MRWVTLGSINMVVSMVPKVTPAKRAMVAPRIVENCIVVVGLGCWEGSVRWSGGVVERGGGTFCW